MNLRKLGRGLRKGLAALAQVGPSLLQVLGIKSKTAQKVVDAAVVVEKGVEVIEGKGQEGP